MRVCPLLGKGFVYVCVFLSLNFLCLIFDQSERCYKERRDFAHCCAMGGEREVLYLFDLVNIYKDKNGCDFCENSIVMDFEVVIKEPISSRWRNFLFVCLLFLMILLVIIFTLAVSLFYVLYKWYLTRLP